MLRLALSTVSTRKFGFAGSFAAVALATALVCAWFTLLLSGLQAAPAADRFGAATAVVRMDPDLLVRTGSGENAEQESVPLDQPPRLPANAAERLAAVAGVRSVVSDTPFYAQVVDRHGKPLAGLSLGHPWQAAALTPFALRTGRAPAAAGEVVLDADLARRATVRPGEQVRILSAGGLKTARVTGIAAPPGRSGLPGQASLFFADADAAQPAFVGVFAVPGTAVEALTARLHAAVPGAEVLTGRERARAGAPEIGDRLRYATEFLGPMGGIGLFLAIFVIAGTSGLSILQRGREIALLRAVGATPGQIRRMLTAEAAAVALAAAIPGCLLGVPLTYLVRWLMVAYEVAPADFRVRPAGLPFIIAVGAGLLVTLPAVLLSVHHAARVRAVEAMREAAAPRRVIPPSRLLLGLIMLAGAAPVGWLAQRVGGEVGVAFQYLVVLILMAAAALLSPLLAKLLTPPAGALIGALARRTGPLAAAACRADVRRVASAAAAVMLSVALGTSALLIGESIEATAVSQARDRVVADRVLTPLDAQGLPVEVAAAARRLPGAAAVSPLRSTTFVSKVLGAPEVLVAQGADPATVGQVLDPSVRAGSLAALAEPGTVAVSRTHARERGWKVGSRFRGWMGDGSRADLRVVAIYDRSLGLGDFLVARAALAGHLREALDDAVLIRAAPGATAELDRALRALPVPVRVLDASGYAGQAHSALSQSTTNVYIVLGLLVAFSALSIVNTCVMSTAERAREFAALRLVGASRGQVVRTICLETAVVLVIGTAVGTVIGLVALAGAAGALTGSAGLQLPTLRYGLVPAGVLLLGLVVSALPAGMVLRYRPIEAVGNRE